MLSRPPSGPSGPTVSSGPPDRRARLVLDPEIAVREYRRLRDALPVTGVHFAVKCQPDPSILAALAAAGCGFEVASPGEVRHLMALGVDPRELINSNPLRSRLEIAELHALGVKVFAVDSLEELAALGEQAPGAAIMARLRTSTYSAVPSEGKLGSDTVTARAILLAAEGQGLEPLGISWHAGSQCEAPSAWDKALAAAGQLMREVAPSVRVELLDLGGGFPAIYDEENPPPPIETYGATIRAAMRDLPYIPERVICEPGRAIAAPAGIMGVPVRRVVRRGRGRRLAALEFGGALDLIEALETGGNLPFPVWDSRGDTAQSVYTLCGRTCDSMDRLLHGVSLSAGLDEGDTVFIGQTGAYSNGQWWRFCGYDVPEIVIADAGHDHRQALNLAGAAV